MLPDIAAYLKHIEANYGLRLGPKLVEQVHGIEWNRPLLQVPSPDKWQHFKPGPTVTLHFRNDDGEELLMFRHTKTDPQTST